MATTVVLSKGLRETWQNKKDRKFVLLQHFHFPAYLKERSTIVITSPCFKRSDWLRASPLTRVGLAELRLVKMIWRGGEEQSAQSASNMKRVKTGQTIFAGAFTSLFSFKSILQCSLETWGSWIRMSHSAFLQDQRGTRQQVGHFTENMLTVKWNGQQKYI